jgi:hypothetical protein
MTGEIDCIFALTTGASPQRIIGGLAGPQFYGAVTGTSGFVYAVAKPP